MTEPGGNLGPPDSAIVFLVKDHLSAAPDHLGSPVFFEDSPKRLIEILPVAEERLPENALLYGSQLAERAVASAVADGRAGFEAVHADRFEGELHDEFGTFLEHAGAPEGRADCEAPFRSPEPRFGRTDLKDSDGRVRVADRHRKAGIR